MHTTQFKLLNNIGTKKRGNNDERSREIFNIYIYVSIMHIKSRKYNSLLRIRIGSYPHWRSGSGSVLCKFQYCVKNTENDCTFDTDKKDKTLQTDIAV